MAEDPESSEIREYITDLKTIKSAVFQVLHEGNKKDLSSAAKQYPVKLNHLLTKRNIISGSGLFPILDMAFLNLRKQDIELIDLNSKKDDIDLLWDVIRRIERELEELNPASYTRK